MLGSLLLLAASVSPVPPPAPDRLAASRFRPTSQVTARARASVTIVAGARFGAGQQAGGAGSIRREVALVEPGGQAHRAYLLEFQ